MTRAERAQCLSAVLTRAEMKKRRDKNKGAKKKTIQVLALLAVLALLTVLVWERARQSPVRSDSEEATAVQPQAVTADAQEKPEFSEAATESTENSAVKTPPTEAVPRPRALREPEIRDDEIPEELFGEAQEKGRVEIVQYTTCDMVSNLEDPIQKSLAVYLPYGYDENGHYDVLMLLHCAWADHRFWLAQARDYATSEGSVPVSVPNLLDRMIEEGYCRPLIVISPCIYLYDGQPSAAGNQYDYLQFEREVGAQLLPFVAENYATWAKDGDRESLLAARDHFGVLGASFGAYATYLSLIGDNFDLMSWYCFCGGGMIDPGHLQERWAANGTQDLPLRMLYIAEGEYDDRAGPELSWQALLRTGGSFTEDNVKFTLIRGYGHEDHSYLVGLYNSLQMFFVTGEL